LILGDVAGKGLGAALLMAKLQATIRALSPGMKSLTKLGTDLNKIFCRDGIPHRFITMVFLELIAHTGKIKILNAGHMPPIIFAGNGITEIAPCNVALSLNAKAAFKSQEYELKKDDMLIVFSDGVSEARNNRDEFFGESSMKKLLQENRSHSCETMGKTLLRKIDFFVGNQRQSDDLSLILLKRD